MQDLIWQPRAVATKAEQTRRVLAFLACRDRAFDPAELHRCVATTFALVQQAWEARACQPVRHLLLPNILAKHEALLQSMRNNHEINRIEGLRVERLELVHVHRPRCEDDQEVAALITFRASVYFVDDRTGAHTRGLRSPGWFRELWTFRRRGEGWLLQDIERSHEPDRPERPNFVADLTDRQSANAQSSIAL
jgi:predicted lipid-binding transport protein (Tim44 family)